MSEARKVALERRHAAIEAELQTLTVSPSTSQFETGALKREKLRLKDEIVKLKT